jgi:Flp pilus assembly protein TadB
MIEAILGPFWQLIAGALAVVGAGLWARAFGRAKKKEGAADERAKHAEQTKTKVEAGRKAVASGRGKPAADRLRANDDRWK